MSNDNPYRAPATDAAESIAQAQLLGGISRITWQTLIALCVTAVLSGILVWALGEETSQFSVSSTLMGLVMVIIVVRWMSYDSRRFDVTITLYWVLGMIFCGLFALPLYFFRTRGWAGWLPTLMALATLLVVSLVESATIEVIRYLNFPAGVGDLGL